MSQKRTSTERYLEGIWSVHVKFRSKFSIGEALIGHYDTEYATRQRCDNDTYPIRKSLDGEVLHLPLLLASKLLQVGPVPFCVDSNCFHASCCTSLYAFESKADEWIHLIRLFYIDGAKPNFDAVRCLVVELLAVFVLHEDDLSCA